MKTQRKMFYQSDIEQFNGRESETATLLWKLQEIRKMHRLSQVLIGAGLIGLLAVPGMEIVQQYFDPDRANRARYLG